MKPEFPLFLLLDELKHIAKNALLRIATANCLDSVWTLPYPKQVQAQLKYFQTKYGQMYLLIDSVIAAQRFMVLEITFP